ncbi:MAG: GntR family transcriptional regulator, partial [Chthoniobacterales bacterium]|nr:GntR family transcriptional regulator [Chthoniobacterales bacterium]
MSLKDRAYDHIFGKMLGGAMRPGARLSDIHLAREIGVSRTPVREAIIQMETQGLVEQVDGVGPRVKNLQRPDLEETFELREILEVAAIGKAVTRITEAELIELQSICDQYLAATRALRDSRTKARSWQLFDRMVVLDMAFHLNLMRAARNRRLLRIIGDVHILSRILRRRAELPGVDVLTRSALVWRDHVR